MLSEEQTNEVKQKLISHIESTFPEEQRENAIQQVEAMNSEQLEKFLERNKLIKQENPEQGKTENAECVFCSIASGAIKSIKIAENKDAITVLEINPISKGHSLVIPREHKEKASRLVLSLAKKVAKNLQRKFSPRSVEIQKSKMFGHETIVILPVYGKENFDSERRPARIEELEKIREELEKKEVRKKTVAESVKSFWLPKRIP